MTLIGKLLRRAARTTDLTARFGGEEFVAILPGAEEEGAVQFAQRLRFAMAHEIWPGGPVTASFGTASLGIGTGSGRELIDKADAAMYEAKRCGKNRIVAYDRGLPRPRARAS